MIILYSMKRLKQIIDVFSFNTWRINFKFLSWKKALKFPVLVSRKCRIKNLSGQLILPEKVHLGMVKIGIDNSNIFDHKSSPSILYIAGKVIFKGKATFGNGCKLQVCENGVLQFGKNICVTAETTFYCSNSIRVGNDCLFSWNILLMDHDHHSIFLHEQYMNPSKPIEIGNKVWIGCNCTVLKGATIAEGCMVGAGSLISKAILTPNCLIGGIPGHILKSDIQWR